MFNVKKFIDRKHWKLEDLSNRLFGKGKTSRVGNWSSGTASPRYEVILQLIELGVTAEELLGKEHADMLINNSLNSAAQETLQGFKDVSVEYDANKKSKPIDYKDPELLDAVKKAMLYLDELKKKSQIK